MTLKFLSVNNLLKYWVTSNSITTYLCNIISSAIISSVMHSMSNCKMSCFSQTQALGGLVHSLNKCIFSSLFFFFLHNIYYIKPSVVLWINVFLTFNIQIFKNIIIIILFYVFWVEIILQKIVILAGLKCFLTHQIISIFLISTLIIRTLLF